MNNFVIHEPSFESSMARHGLPWTRDDDATLRVMVRHRDLPERIAEVLQRSVNAVTKRWEFIGRLPEGLWPTAYKENGDFDPASNRPLSEQLDLPQPLNRLPRPSRKFPNKWANTCCVCRRRMPKGELVHFVAIDRLAHAGCF